jgi:hypothetical protein
MVNADNIIDQIQDCKIEALFLTHNRSFWLWTIVNYKDLFDANTNFAKKIE